MSVRPRPQDWSAGSARAFPAVVAMLAMAAALELVVLRSFTRTAIHIPAMQPLARPYEALAWLGRFDYHAAAVLLAIAAIVGTAALAQAGRAGVFASSGVLVFLLVAIAARLGWLDNVTQAIGMAAAVGVVGVSCIPLRGRAGVVIALYVAGFVCSAAAETLQAGAAYGLPEVDARSLLWFAEVFAVSFAAASPWALGVRRHRLAVAAGGLAGVLTFAMLLAPEGAATTKILMLWNIGLIGALPSIAYALAAGGLVTSIAGLVRERRGFAAAGLALVAMGGFGLHSTYQSGLAVVGLAALCIALQSAPRERV